MINPVLSNFRIDFDDAFFPLDITKKYDDFLFHKNTPFKSLRSHLYESIQTFNIPGINLNTITAQGLQNLGLNPKKGDWPHSTVNRHFAGTAPMNEIFDGILFNVTFRNTILNWMYLYEILFRYYKRSRDVDQFGILITMMDSAEVPMIRFKLGDCFISTIVGLEFSFNQSFSESKTFDCGFTFNTLDVEFLVPNFDLKSLEL
jgi:hypothetical protein